VVFIALLQFVYLLLAIALRVMERVAEPVLELVYLVLGSPSLGCALSPLGWATPSHGRHPTPLPKPQRA
jgi:cytochrome bd-type quinol oxidase subunit 1